MPAFSRDQFLTDIGRALRASHGEAESDAQVRPLEPWLDFVWPFPEGAGTTAVSPRTSVAAAEIAVRAAFPDRARELLATLGRILAIATLAEAVTWESLTTTRTEARPFRRVSFEPEPFENPEKGFHRADDEGRIALLQSITAERAESLVRRRVHLRAGTLDGGRILLTRLTSSGTAELPFSAFWVEHVRLEESSQHGGPGNFLVSWLPPSYLPAADRAMANGAPHAWCEDTVERFAVTAWLPAWVR